jgi:hypothetical protein
MLHRDGSSRRLVRDKLVNSAQPIRETSGDRESRIAIFRAKDVHAWIAARPSPQG